jgi:hypothetical protein
MITAKNQNNDKSNKNSPHDKVEADKNIAEAARDRLKGIYKDIVVNDVSKSVEAAESSLKQHIDGVKDKLAKDISNTVYDNEETITKKTEEIIEKIDEELIKTIEDRFEELNSLLEANKVEESNLLEEMKIINKESFNSLSGDNKQINSQLASLKISLKEAEVSLEKDLESFSALYTETEKISSSEINKGLENLLEAAEKEFGLVNEKIDSQIQALEAKLEGTANMLCDTVSSNSKELNNSIEKLRSEYAEEQQKYFQLFKKFQYVIISEAVVIILMLIFIIFR